MPIFRCYISFVECNLDSDALTKNRMWPGELRIKAMIGLHWIHPFQIGSVYALCCPMPLSPVQIFRTKWLQHRDGSTSYPRHLCSSEASYRVLLSSTKTLEKINWSDPTDPKMLKEISRNDELVYFVTLYTPTKRWNMMQKFTSPRGSNPHGWNVYTQGTTPPGQL